MRRWHRKGISTKAVIEWNGEPVGRINKAFRSGGDLCGLGKEVVPHTLRHTCATWLAQRGVPIHQICGFLGMSVEMFQTSMVITILITKPWRSMRSADDGTQISLIRDSSTNPSVSRAPANRSTKLMSIIWPNF